MRANLFILSVLALFTFTQAGSFRALQQGPVVDPNPVVAPVPVPVPVAVPTPAPVDNVTVVDNTTNSTNTTTPVNAHPGYKQLNVTEAYQDPIANGAFMHAMNAVVQTAIAQGKIPVALYNITEWQGAWSRNRRGGVEYIVQAHLVAPNGVNFYANVTVFHNNATGKNGMSAYHYRATNITKGLFPSGGYRFLTPAQVHNNTIVQGALVYGAKTMIEYLINEKKIPGQDLNYTIYNLYLAAYRRYRAGTSYKFQIFASNAAGVNVRTNYTVFYRNSNKTYAQTAYWYRAWNFNSSDINNGTNSTNVTVVNNSTGDAANVNTTVVDNTTVVANTTAPAADANATEVTAANATSGTNSTAGVPVNVTTNPVQVNINATLVTMDNTTSTSTALVFENVPIVNDNSTSGSNSTEVTPVDTTLPASNVTVVDNSTSAAANGSA